MPTADKYFGATLIALKPVVKYNGALQPIRTFKAGQTVGVIYSYIVRNGAVYWMVYDNPFQTNPFYVLHTTGSFKVTGQIKDINDAAEIASKGKFIFYLEKYLNTALFITGAYLLITKTKTT
jgi:hypothetical protein